MRRGRPLSEHQADLPPLPAQRIFSTHALWYHFDRKGWRDDFRQVQRRCVCLVCWFHHREKVRNPDLEFVNEPPTDTRFPTPPEFTWKQEQRRRR